MTPAPRANNPSSTPRRDIQFLRAFAVLSVMAYHFELAGVGGGFVGVDIFFVISGYLIFGQIHKQISQHTFSLPHFFAARLRRIFPALAVVCFATALWGWHFVLPRDFVHYSRTALAALCFVSNFAFDGAQGYFDAASHTKPLLHTWSLSVEGQFYFWLPLLLLALLKIRGSARLWTALILSSLASFNYALWLAYYTPESGFYHVLARAWEFGAGAMCATLGVRKFTHGRSISSACMAGLIASVALLDGSTAWPNVWTLIPVGCAAGFIYLAVHEQHNAFLAHPYWQRIGDMSYSLYLWHWPVWVAARQLLGEQISIAEKLALLGVTTVLAYLSWRWVEQPFRNRQRISSKPFTIAVISSLLCCTAFTAFVVLRKGEPQRFPDYVSRAAIQGAQNTPRGECFRSGSNTKEAVETFCTYGIPSSAGQASAMLWGDSHANQYLTPLDNASRELGITGLIATMSGCRAFIETDAIQHSDFAHCKDFNREVFAYLLQHTEIKTVILGRIWSDGDETIQRTVRLTQALAAQGRRVILITPLPLPGMHVESGWATRQIQAGRAIDEIKLPATSEVKQTSTLRKLRAQLQPELSQEKVFLLDPTQRLCDTEFCYVVREGIANFRDTSHLTEVAAQGFQTEFKNVLLRARAGS